MRFPRKLWVVLGAAAAAVAAAGIAYAAIPGSDGTFHACMLNTTGAIRLIDPSLSPQNLRSHCTALESPVTWNQQGPAGQPGPPGTSDSTVRHISNFQFDGSTVTTPVLNGTGEIGKLSLTCGDDAGGGTGLLTFTPDAGEPFNPRVIFYSPEVASSPTYSEAGQASFSWSDAPGDHVMLEVLIEGLTPKDNASSKPTLTDIHGFVQHFNEFEGCNFYFHIDTSNVNSGETFTQ
jgi:hypothetical protein